MIGLGTCRAVLVLLFVSFGLSQDEVPSVEAFRRRASSRASIIGHYIYFNGGEIGQGNYTDPRYSNPANATLSIDLSVSWRPEEVTIRELTKPLSMIPMIKESIFTDQETGAFYTWGGSTSWFAPIGDPVLWYFEADEEGGGEWHEQESINLRDIERVDSGAHVSTPDPAFVFGGKSTAQTSQEPKGNMDGYVSFNFKTREWTREFDAPYSATGTLYGGTATFVPDYGPNGLIFVLGGLSQYDEEDAEYPKFREVFFLDPVTKEWQSQVTTGEPPVERHFHCAAGVSSGNDTFEIFVFGGRNVLEGAYYSDMYVLTLPGFRWTKVTGLDTAPRAEQSCPVVGRQFLSWGGVDRNNNARMEWAEKDPFPQGIGIFDMTTWEWRDEYSATATSYDSHPDIRGWYSDGGIESVEWSSDEVRSLFVVQETGDGGNSETDDDNNGTDEESSSPPTEGQNDATSSTASVGAIAGGVVGGVAVLAGLGLGIWFLQRRRRAGQPSVKQVEQAAWNKQTEPEPHQMEDMPILELHDTPLPAELGYERYRPTPTK